MSDKEDTSLVPRPSGELVRIPPGASAIIDGMVDDATAIIRTRDTDQQEKSLAQSGIRLDPELVQAGGRMAHLYVKSGIHRFVDFAKHMAAEFGAKVKPYIQPLYEWVRSSPDTDPAVAEMLDSPEEVDRLAEPEMLEKILSGALDDNAKPSRTRAEAETHE